METLLIFDETKRSKSNEMVNANHAFHSVTKKISCFSFVSMFEKMHTACDYVK
jgi:hypothetical protein